LTKGSGGEIHRWPQILPGGQAVLFTIAPGEGNFDGARIAVLDLRTRSYRVVVNSGANARYVPTGHLVYMRGGTLFAVSFDLKRLAVTGAETPVVERINYNPAGGFAEYALSDSGLLAYRADARTAGELRVLSWVDLKGIQQLLPAPPNENSNLRLSPDGQRAAVMIAHRTGADIWVYDFVGGTLTRLTSEGTNLRPVWTPDGRRIVFGTTTPPVFTGFLPTEAGNRNWC
jgi:serine/threonine-protein kinase